MLPFFRSLISRNCARTLSVPSARSQKSLGTRNPVLLTLLGIFSLLMLAGCGGNDTVAVAPAYAGRYTGSATLANSQTGALDMTVAQNGSATATLTVNDNRAVKLAHSAATRAIVATYTLTGSVNLNSGAYLLSGTITGATGDANIQFKGNLPPNGSNPFTLFFGSQTFGGTLTGSVALNGTSSQVNFTGASGTNANTASFTGVTVAATQNLPVIGSTTSIAIALPDGQRQVAISINSGLVVGHIYVAGDGTTSLLYTEGSKMWSGQNGQIIIDAINGSEITFRVLNVDMSPYPVLPGGGSASGSTGTFKLYVNAVPSSAGAPPGNSGAGLTISGLTANTSIAKNGLFNGVPAASKIVSSFTIGNVTYDGQYTVLDEQTNASFAGDIFGLTLTAGQIFDLTDPRVNFSYAESGKVYNAVSGSEKIVAISSTSLTVQLTNVRFTAGPNGATSTPPVTGEFTVNGTITCPIR